MGCKADPKKTIRLNGAFFMLCAILRFVIASAVEAELGVLFLNCIANRPPSFDLR
jgi:hypothetical protein